MKSLRTILVALAVTLSGTAAWAQFGLYGSPEMLNLSPAQPVTASYSSYAPAPTSPGMPNAPAAQAVPWASGYTSPAQSYARPLVQTVAVDPGARLPAEPAPPVAPWLGSAAPQAEAGSSMVGQMLSEADTSGQAAYDSPSAGGNPGNGCGIRQGIEAYEQACGSYCGAEDCMPVCCQSPWYAQASVLVFSRNKANRLWTSHQSPPPLTNEANQLMNTQDIGLPWAWGGEIRFGRRFCCGQWAVEATYWTIDPFEGIATAWHPDGVSTPLVVGNVSFGGNPGTNYFDQAYQHRLWRRDEFHNIEVDLVQSPMIAAYDIPWTVDWSLGVRYFRFEERLIFGSCAGGYVWGQDPSQEAYLNDHIENNLVGFQFGCRANYRVGHSLRLFAAPKVGIYNNRMEHYFQAYLGDGTIATPDPTSGQTGTYPVRSQADALSFLTEIDVGVDWQFSRNWSAQIGYRVIAATDIALADNQIPTYVVDIPEIADIDHNGDLILHGAFASLTYNF